MKQTIQIYLVDDKDRYNFFLIFPPLSLSLSFDDFRVQVPGGAATRYFSLEFSLFSPSERLRECLLFVTAWETTVAPARNDQDFSTRIHEFIINASFIPHFFFFCRAGPFLRFVLKEYAGRVFGSFPTIEIIVRTLCGEEVCGFRICRKKTITEAVMPVE